MHIHELLPKNNPFASSQTCKTILENFVNIAFVSSRQIGPPDSRAPDRQAPDRQALRTNCPQSGRLGAGHQTVVPWGPIVQALHSWAKGPIVQTVRGN